MVLLIEGCWWQGRYWTKGCCG